jgi:hypothetical protein
MSSINDLSPARAKVVVDADRLTPVQLIEFFTVSRCEDAFIRLGAGKGLKNLQCGYYASDTVDANTRH